MDGEPGRIGLWGRLGERRDAPPTSAAAPNLWQVVEERLDAAKLRPRPIGDFELAEVGSSPAGKRYMVKNLRNGAYLGLTEPKVFLWNLMDGTNSVKSMVIELFVEHKRYAPEHVVQLVELLKANGFLAARHTPVLASLTRRLLGRHRATRLLTVLQLFTSAKLTIPNADRHFSTMHHRLGWLFFTSPGLAIGFVLFLASIFFHGLHGLVIWHQPIPRAAAILVGVAVLGTIAICIGRGSFKLREIVEVCDDRTDGRALFRVVADGRPFSADVWLRYVGGEEHLHAPTGAISAVADLRSILFRLPGTVARELKIWVHQITPEGDSLGLAAEVAVGSGPDATEAGSPRLGERRSSASMAPHARSRSRQRDGGHARSRVERRIAARSWIRDGSSHDT